jgi:hypothetical protein
MRRAAVALGLVLTAACGSQNVSCTLIGGFDGVSVDVTPWVLRHRTAAEVTACVEQACRTEPTADPRILLLRHPFHGPRDVHVRVTMRDGAKKVLAEQRGVFPLSKSQPNGPGCDPTVWVAVVSLTADGRLVLREPPSAKD